MDSLEIEKLKDENKGSELTIVSLLKTIEDLERASSEAHPHIDEPKSDTERCKLCEAISSARIMLLLNKHVLEEFRRKFL